MSDLRTGFDGYRANKLSVAVVMTGGTIAKSYDPSDAQLRNFEPKVKDLIDGLRTDDLDLTYIDLLHMDSLDIGDEERTIIVEQVTQCVANHDAVLVTHGSDSMAETSETFLAAFGKPDVPIVFTGAMVPYCIAGSDAAQNVTEALLALRILPAGVYIAFHNRILSIPGVRKNYDSLTFERAG